MLRGELHHLGGLQEGGTHLRVLQQGLRRLHHHDGPERYAGTAAGAVATVMICLILKTGDYHLVREVVDLEKKIKSMV